jgi:hypothetical protein
VTFQISAAAALIRNREAQGSIDWRSRETRQNALDLAQALAARMERRELRDSGFGSRGENAAALHYILNAAADNDIVQSNLTDDQRMGFYLALASRQGR